MNIGKINLKKLAPISKVSNIIIDHAKGCWLYPKNETLPRKILDFTSGIGALNTGHSDKCVQNAVIEQVKKASHIQQNLLAQDHAIKLSEKLDKYMATEDNRYFYNVSGSEAIESSIKLARSYTNKPNIISFENGFHGRTLTALSLSSSNMNFRSNYGPYSQGSFISLLSNSVERSVDNLKGIFKTHSRPEETAALLIEPVQGEGGINVISPKFMQEIRNICNQNNILLIADEIQSGVGRTGKFFAHEHSNIVPDIVVMAKGISSGYPLSLISARSEIYKNMSVGSMGGTFGPNIVSCAAANATLEIIENKRLVENAQRKGDYLMKELLKLKKQFPDYIYDVRGIGLMTAIEFYQSSENIAIKFIEKCLEKDLLLMKAGTREIVRLMPPLIITNNEIDFAINVMIKVLNNF